MYADLMKRSFFVAATVVAITLIAPACADELGAPELVEVSLELNVRSDSILVLDNAVAEVTVYDGQGRTIEDPPIRWSSDDLSTIWVDTVSQTPRAVLKASNVGDATISARIVGQSFAPTEVNRTVVSFPSDVFFAWSKEGIHFTALQDSQSIGAVGVGLAGAHVPARRAEWTTVDGGVIRLRQSELGDSATAISAQVGTTQLIVSHNACPSLCSDTLDVQVDQVPAEITIDPVVDTVAINDSTQLEITARDSNSMAIATIDCSWSSSDTSVADVSGSGFVTGKSEGTTAITAICENVADTASVVVDGTAMSGFIESDLSWTPNEDPIFIKGHVLVAPNASVQVAPGTRIIFEGNYYIRVDGEFAAIGSPDDSISFSAASPDSSPGFWEAILFSDSSVDATFDSAGRYESGSAITYSDIKNGGAIQFYRSSPYFAHNRVSYMAGADAPEYLSSFGVIWGYETASIIEDNAVEENLRSGMYFSRSRVTIRRNTIRYNNEGGIHFEYYCDHTHESDTLIGKTLVSDNRIIGNSAHVGAGISIGRGACDIRIEHNLISDNVVTSAPDIDYGNTSSGGAAIAVFWGELSNSEIIYNTILNNRSTSSGVNSAVMVAQRFDAIIQNNNLSNETAFELLLTVGADSLKAPSNYWGVGPDSVSSVIYDFHDDFNLAEVYFDPPLTEPDSTAGPRG